jgi:hypothetical protein
LDPEEARSWIMKDERNREILRPYLNGEDLNSRPDSSAARWVIDFNDRSEESASRYPIPFERIVDRVKPERANNSRKVRRERWWQFAENAAGLRRAIVELDEVLAIARISSTIMPIRVPANQVFNEKVCVFATDSFATQAVLSSGAHQMWVTKYSSTLRTDINYSASDVFATFPLPEETKNLTEIGDELDKRRREMLRRRVLGLTKIYNLLNDPTVTRDEDIDQLREIHIRVDESVMAAYGWQDIELGHGFHTYRQMRRWTISPQARVKVMDLLLEENQRRAKSEEAIPPIRKTSSRGRNRKGHSAARDQEGLF